MQPMMEALDHLAEFPVAKKCTDMGQVRMDDFMVQMSIHKWRTMVDLIASQGMRM